MDIREMEYFEAVCKHRSILKASQTLYISQQALSKAMKKIETNLDICLFDRGTNSISLTKEGEYLYQKVSKQLKQHRHFEQDIYDHFSKEEIIIKMGVVPGAVRTIGTDVLLEFFEKEKRVYLDIVESYDKACQTMILKEDLDIAVSTKPLYLEGFVYYPIQKEELYVIAHKDFPLPNNTQLYLEQLIDVPMALCDTRLNLRLRIEEAFKRIKAVPNIIFQANEIEVMIDIVAKGKAINICAKHVTEGLEKKDILVIPLLDTNIDWEIGVLVKQDKVLSKQLHSLLNALK